MSNLAERGVTIAVGFIPRKGDSIIGVAERRLKLYHAHIHRRSATVADFIALTVA